jgi:outer membrane protein assembly factor BamB
MGTTRREWLAALPVLGGANLLKAEPPRLGGGDWPLFRGDARRNGVAAGGPPAAEPRWRHPMVTWSSEPEDRAADDRLAQLARPDEGRHLPAFLPVAAGDRAVAASFHGARVVSLADGRLLSAQGDGNGVFAWARWPAQGGLPDAATALAPTLAGAPAIDGPFYLWSEAAVVRAPGREASPSSLRGAALDNGKLVWAVGGPLDSSVPEGPVREPNFRSSPLPLAGRLYALDSKERDLRLVALDTATRPRDARFNRRLWELNLTTLPGPPPGPPLASVPDRLPPLHLAADDGRVVCPTPDGAVVVVDAAKPAVAWTYRHTPAEVPPVVVRPGRPRPAVEPPVPWGMLVPVIADGKVVVTPPGSPELVCLSLADGKLLWRAKRGDDLFVAAIAGGTVALVGPTQCRGLKLADGSAAWQTETGTPAGLGVRLGGGRYLLPLRAAAVTTKPAFAVLELSTGKVTERVPVADADDLGSLAVGGGLVLSQSLRRLTAFAQR